MIFLAALAIFAGGILKGATGAGVPILAIPALTMVYDIRIAIAVMTVPNVLSNVWQAWQYRHDLPDRGYLLTLVFGAFVGAIVGTLMLASISPSILAFLVAGAVWLYIGLRVAQPDVRLAERMGQALAFPASFVGGALQGATGISAPASLTYLNAMRLPRGTFVATASIMFVAMTATQIASLVAVKILTWPLFLFGFIALALVIAGMQIGTWLGKKMSGAAFDRMILALLFILSLRLMYDALSGL